MLTILNVSQNHYLRGGSDRMFFATMRAQEQHGHRAIPFTASDPRNIATEWSRYFPIAANFDAPTPIDLARYIYSQPAKESMRKLIADQKPDLAHLHIYYGKLTTSVLHALKEKNIPTIQTLHEYRLMCPVSTFVAHDHICEDCKGGNYWQALPKRCNRNSLARTALSVSESYASRWLGALSAVDHFIAVSDFVREKMIAHGIAPDHITTIHNCVDASTVTPSANAGKYFLYFGRLEKTKGIMTLIDAIAPLKNFPLWIVGDGALKESIQARIAADGLDHISLRGFLSGESLAEAIANSLCAILPAEWYETFGLTILEAFMHGRTAIASRIGGIPEIIDDGENGLLFEPGSADDLRAKLEWIAAHPGGASEMGMRGRAKLEREFNPEKYYDELMAVYRKVL
jgi:glycosyltransferase involved in cell wall biosynthesis